MNTPEHSKPRPHWSRRRKIGVLIAFYAVSFSASIPFIEVGDGRAARLYRVHEAKAAQCRQAGKQARAAGRDEVAQRLAQSAANHDWFADVYRHQASLNRWTWLTWLIKSAEDFRWRRSNVNLNSW